MEPEPRVPSLRRAVAARLLLSLAIASAVPLSAQDKAPKGARPKQGEPPPAAAPRKDDALTAKDRAIVANDKFAAKRVSGRKAKGWRGSLPVPQQLPFDAAHDYHWHLATSKGEIVIRLLVDVAPMHATNAIHLTRLGYYDTLLFHRVIQGFMAQGGCPLGTGSGGPGYTIDGECTPAVKHDRPGLVSTANEDGKPKTDGSQFFLTFAPAPHLDGKHTIFGEVIAGMEVLQAIDACGGRDGKDAPTEALSIRSAWVVVVAKAAPAPDAAPKAPDGEQGRWTFVQALDPPANLEDGDDFRPGRATEVLPGLLQQIAADVAI